MDLMLSRVATSLSGAQDLETLTRSLLELLESVTRLESTYLTTIDEQRGIQHILFSRNTSAMQIPEGLDVPWNDTLCQRALQEGRPYTQDVPGCWGDSDAARALGIRTYLSQPVQLVDGKIYGTLCGASAGAVDVPPETLKILALFARMIAHQVERERLVVDLRRSNDELERRAHTDALTGVANRRALLQELARTLQQVRRDGRVQHVAFIDLDGFKAINDLYGHEAGDSLLVQLAGRIRAGLRGGDLLARYGGDEFVVIGSGSDPEELGRRLEELTVGRYPAGEQFIDYRGASVGVTTVRTDDRDAEQVLGRADAAMYARKQVRKVQRFPA